MDIDRVIARLAEQHHGAFARSEARAEGISRKVLASRIGRGSIDEWSPRVLRVAGTEPTELQRIAAATLDVAGGAVASFFTAAWLWKFPGFWLVGLEVTAKRKQFRTSSLAYVHRPMRLLPHHVTVWKGIPVTSVARTIWDLAGVIHPKRLERLIDNVCAKSPEILPQLHRMLRELGGRGVPGTVVMRELLQARPVGIKTTPSGNQAKFEEIMAGAGITGLRLEVDLGGSSWIGRVDYVDDVTGGVVEVDSALNHSSPSDVAADEARDAALLAAGFPPVLRIKTEEMWPCPWIAVEAVHEHRSRYRKVVKAPRSGTENGSSAS